MQFPSITDTVRMQRLTPPTGKVRAVLDTDTYNEVDDQFAIVQALLSPEQIDLQAIYAAPFDNDRSDGAGDGMEKSYEEILRLLSRLDVSAEGFVYRGSTGFLPSRNTPCTSAAASDLVERALRADDDEPLYVIAIGAITNIASAILLEPEIVRKIVVVWLGGHALHWPHTREFNLKQDVPAAQILFDCGVPLVMLPCMNVASHLLTTVPELEQHVAPHGAIGEFLTETVKGYSDNHTGWAKEIWDMAAVAWLLNPQWVPSELAHSPILTDGITWSVDRSRHLIRIANHVQRNPIFRDFFEKLAKRGAAQ